MAFTFKRNTVYLVAYLFANVEGASDPENHEYIETHNSFVKRFTDFSVQDGYVNVHTERYFDNFLLYDMCIIVFEVDGTSDSADPHIINIQNHLDRLLNDFAISCGLVNISVEWAFLTPIWKQPVDASVDYLDS